MPDGEIQQARALTQASENFSVLLGSVLATALVLGVGAFGVLEALSGAGALIASAIAVVWRPAHPLRVGLVLTLIWPLQGIALALLAPVALLAPLVIMIGFGFSLMAIW